MYRSMGIVWIILLILAILFSSLNLSWLFDSTDGGSRGPHEAISVVSEDGFSLQLSGVTITGDAGVAPAGTQIHAQLLSQQLPADAATFSEPVGTGVEVTLGDNLQPATPLTIRFAPNVVSDWYDNATDDVLPVVFASKEEFPGVEFADAHFQGDGSVVVTADHLSWFQPVMASVSRFAGWVVEQADIGMAVRSVTPACYTEHSENEEWEFSEIPEQILWPCAATTDTGVNANLTLNSTGVWLVSSEQAVPGQPMSFSISDLVLQQMTLPFLDGETTSALFPPDSSVTFWAFSPEDEIQFHAVLNPPLTTINAAVTTLLAMTPGRVVEQIAGAQCLLDVIEEMVSDMDAIDGSVLRTVVDCIARIMGGMGGFFIGTITTVPTVMATLFDGIHREITGRSQFSFSLSRTDVQDEEIAAVPTPATTPVSAPVSSWPTHRNDSVTGLYIWLGANFYNFPDWVACDDARDWCLIGNDGDWHILVGTGPLREVGSVHDTYASPWEALQILGLPEDSIEQILGD